MVEVGLPVDVGAVDQHAVVLVARLDGHLVAVATERGVDRMNAKMLRVKALFKRCKNVRNHLPWSRHHDISRTASLLLAVSAGVRVLLEDVHDAPVELRVEVQVEQVGLGLLLLQDLLEDGVHLVGLGVLESLLQGLVHVGQLVHVVAVGGLLLLEQHLPELRGTKSLQDQYLHLKSEPSFPFQPV